MKEVLQVPEDVISCIYINKGYSLSQYLQFDGNQLILPSFNGSTPDNCEKSSLRQTFDKISFVDVSGDHRKGGRIGMVLFKKLKLFKCIRTRIRTTNGR